MAKSKSRAARCSDACQDIRNGAEDLREALTVETIEAALAKVANGRFKLEALRDEVTEWADNIEEKFGSTDKYQRLRDTADALESAIGSLEGVDIATDPIPDEDEREAVASEAEGYADDAEQADFPGMFG